MPHIIVKMHSGRSEEQKQLIAEAMTKAIMESALCSEAAVSVAIEDVEPYAWNETVYKTDIAAHPELIYKQPGYKPAE